MACQKLLKLVIHHHFMQQTHMELVQLAQAPFLWSWQSVLCEVEQGYAYRQSSLPVS